MLIMFSIVIQPKSRLFITYGVCIRKMCNHAYVVGLAGGESFIYGATLSSLSYPYLIYYNACDGKQRLDHQINLVSALSVRDLFTQETFD